MVFVACQVYGMWVAASIFVTVSANMLLTWYTAWYRQFQEGSWSVWIMWGFLFLQSWIMASLTGELVRFCFLLAGDACKEDGFSEYRDACAALVLDPPLNCCGDSCQGRVWPCLTRLWQCVTCLWQWITYFSFIVVPLISLVWTCWSGGSPQLPLLSDAVNAAFQGLGCTAIFHVLCYFTVWTLHDYCCKMREAGCCRCCISPQRASEFEMAECGGEPVENPASADAGTVEAEKETPSPWADLVKRHCEVAEGERAHFRSIFVLVVGLQLLLLRQLPGADWGVIPCSVMLILIWCFSVCRCRHPSMNWKYGVIEQLLIYLLTIFLSFFSFLRPWEIGCCFCMSLALQCGCQRKMGKGTWVKVVVVLLLNGLLVVLFYVLAGIIHPQHTPASKFLSRTHSESQFYEVPSDVREPALASNTMCSLRFPKGNGSQALRLSDFALFSAIVYEEKEDIQRALPEYLPGWVITSMYQPDDRRAGEDWSTYYEFSDLENTTTIFALRGTQSLLDVLTDINLFTPAALIQLFSMTGPSIASAAIEIMVQVHNFLAGHKAQHTRWFKDKIKTAVRKHPGRRFYLTGHSLGGGLAKLAALEANVQAVTFMAPGEHLTKFTTYAAQHKNRDFLDRLSPSLTLMPENDIVSRIDWQDGGTVPAPCKGTSLECHYMRPMVCTIMQHCGSGRNESLWLPCTWCSGSSPRPQTCDSTLLERAQPMMKTVKHTTLSPDHISSGSNLGLESPPERESAPGAFGSFGAELLERF